MRILRLCVLMAVCCVPLCAWASEPVPKAADTTWAKIVVDQVTPEMNKKALEMQSFAAVGPEVELTFDLKKLGAEGVFSMKAVQKKYGPPAKTETFATREDGKIVTYRRFVYPPLAFVVPAGSDQPASLAAPKRVWTGGGILENAKSALKTD